MRCLTDEELQLASRFLFLSMAMVVIQQDMQSIQCGKFKIKEPYMNLLDKMNAKATAERRLLRRKMKLKNIRVVTLEKNDSFSSYLFLSDGCEEKRNYFNPAIRKKVQTVIQDLMDKSLTPSQHYAASDN